ncbi:ATP-binding cassette domain-containing protein [[Clostridium] innocuum]|nr:ATP-binding cassette domain-containing protein [[Clostridium] innocuum]
MKEWIVETNALTKKFRSFTAVDQVSFHMKKGSITGLIGPNGAGKSTMMKLMSGMLHATEGELKLFGKHPKEDPFIFRRVGTLIENAGLYPALTAYDNLKMKALMLGCCNHELIMNLLKLCSLSTTGKKKAGNFSMGMKQRLGIAMALLGDPELLILDEPTNGLDPQGICDMRDLLKRLQEERGMSILISSHMLAELDKIATDFAVIRSGKIVEQFTKDELLERCRDCFQLKVDDVKKASVILEEKCFVETYEVLPKGILRLYDHYEDPSQIAKHLVMNNIALYGMEDHHQDLEAYFLKEGEAHVE